MRNPWISIAQDAMRLGIEAQSVMALRLSGFARREHGWKEAHRMVAEKAGAFAEVQNAAARSMMIGGKSHQVAKKTLRIYGRRVRANRRRLGGGSLVSFWRTLGSR